MVFLTLIKWGFTFIGIAMFYEMYKTYKNKSPLETKKPDYRPAPYILFEGKQRLIESNRRVGWDTWYVTFKDGTGHYFSKGDLKPMDMEDVIFGDEEPVFISRKELIKNAYDYEDLPTRDMFKKMLVELIEKDELDVDAATVIKEGISILTESKPMTETIRQEKDWQETAKLEKGRRKQAERSERRRGDRYLEFAKDLVRGQPKKPEDEK